MLSGMWLEIVLSEGDLTSLLREVTPLTITLGEQQWIAIESPSEVALVADVGLRVTCKAKVKWPLLGIGVPVTIHRMVVTFAPEVMQDADGSGESLVFGLRLQHADFAGLPDAIDARLSKAIDEALVAHRLDLAWKFTETLAGSIPLPATLDPIHGLSVHVAWAKVKVTDEAMVVALSLHHAFHRQGEPPPDRKNLPEKQARIDPPARIGRERRSIDDRSRSIVAPAVVAIGLGAFAGALFGAWAWRRR